MDNPLTPRRIQKLINLAEGRTIERILLTEDDVKLIARTHQANKSPSNYESSSGILDLDHMEAFGESCSIANMSLSKSTAFNPGEMTGRSTGAEEIPTKSTLDVPKTQQYGRHSIDLDSIINEMDKQTSEVNEIMRYSIATNNNYSFHSKRDLTADEASLIAREAPLPIMQTTQTYFPDSVSANTSSVSMGAYFKNRCVDFGNILTKTDSPDRSNLMPSITEVSNYEHLRETNLIAIDDTLDSVPVRQPRNSDVHRQGLPANSLAVAHKINKPLFKEPMRVAEKPDTRIAPETNKGFAAPAYAHKSFMTSSKPADVLLKNLHTSLRLVTEEAEGSSIDNSISISKIAECVWDQSNASVTDLMQVNKRQPVNKKQPLTELHMNTQQVQVTKLIDTKKVETASSAGTLATVISVDDVDVDKLDIPEMVITPPDETCYDGNVGNRVSRSKSPLSKSPSTLTTVRHNSSGFKSAGSLNSSKGEANRSKIPSPNIVYKELDKSVDWQDVLQQKRMRRRGVAKAHWVEIQADPVEGFVGVSTAVTISVKTLSDRWLTAKFQLDNLPNEGKDFSMEVPRLPILLSPGKTENFTFYITFNVEMDTELPFTFHVKDASEGSVEQKGDLKVKFRIPTIQAMSADGLNKLTFPPIQESMSITKTFVLLSDCPADLQITLLLTEGDSMFCIKSVQEIRKSDVNKAIVERRGPEEKSTRSKAKMNKQLCRLVSGNAIAVSITFDAPKLDDLNIQSAKATLTGAFTVTLIGGDTVLKKVDLIGCVASPAQLLVNAIDNKVKVTREGTEITVANVGGVAGNWWVKYKPRGSVSAAFPFMVTPNKFELAAGETRTLQLVYTGPDDCLIELAICFEENNTGNSTDLTLTGGGEKPRSFPIKSNHNSLSWVRAGRKEVSLKNNMDKKVHIRCQIDGEGFSIDMPGCKSRGIFVLSFNGCECRPLPILFSPTSCAPHTATLHLAYDRNSEFCRKIKLFGCAGGEAARWAGLVTFSESAALVRAVPRAPTDLRLHNRGKAPAFVAASVHFNLQYSELEQFSKLVGAAAVIPARAFHTVSLRVAWARAEQWARAAPGPCALATLTALSGAELTRRRVLRLFKDESTGKVDVSQLPDNLKVLAQEFEGEDSDMDNLLADFNEPKASLSELMSGLRELTAHIELPHDFAEENTIIISDDTVIEHHTLCD